MPRFRLLLCGPFRLVSADGTAVTGLGAKAQALLAHLAAQPHQQASRRDLAERLWDGDGARHALRQAILVLRQRLGPGTDAVLRIDPAELALGPGVETDLADFELLLAAGRIEEACGLWRGPFCAGLDAGSTFDEWLQRERTRLDERAAGAFGQLARLAETEGRIAAATIAAQRLVALDPLNDAAQAALIALYRRRGMTEAARLAHRRCVGLFHHELGIAPGAEVQAAARTPVALVPAAIAMPSKARDGGIGHPVWHRWAAAAVLLLAAGVAADFWEVAPEPAEAAPAAAWVEAGEWRPGAPPDTRGLPLRAAIARGLAGDPDFAHLVPAGC